jgi:hypothetical protein
MGVESRTAESVGAAYSPAGVADQLQAATVTHIKAALRLSREGSPAGARLHAALARTALETASEYMEKDQFLLFKSAVELRLRRLEGRPGADASLPKAGQ